MDRYTEALSGDVAGVRVGLLKEAFEWEASESDVNQLVRSAVSRLQEKGVQVQEVSLPLFKDAESIWLGVVTHSGSAMIESDQEGYWRGGYCNVGWQAAFGKSRRVWADDFSLFTKARLVLGKYLRREYMSTYFSKAQNLRMLLRDQLNEVLSGVDVLAMPTTPYKPTKLAERFEGADPRIPAVRRALSGTSNTSPFNLSGHPALTVPCGISEGLPVALQLVGRHWEEGLLLRLGYALEEAGT